MKLKLTIISFKRFHLDNGCFLKVVESQFLTLEIGHILNDFCQCVNQINDIVTLIEYWINLVASFLEFPLIATLDHSLHKIWMGLVTYFEYVFFINKPETGSCCLKIIQGISHITFSSKNNSFISISGMLELFWINYMLQPLQHFFISQFCESHECASRLNWLN